MSLVVLFTLIVVQISFNTIPTKMHIGTITTQYFINNWFKQFISIYFVTSRGQNPILQLGTFFVKGEMGVFAVCDEIWTRR